MLRSVNLRLKQCCIQIFNSAVSYVVLRFNDTQQYIKIRGSELDKVIGVCLNYGRLRSGNDSCDGD